MFLFISYSLYVSRFYCHPSFTTLGPVDEALTIGITSTVVISTTSAWAALNETPMLSLHYLKLQPYRSPPHIPDILCRPLVVTSPFPKGGDGWGTIEEL